MMIATLVLTLALGPTGPAATAPAPGTPTAAAKTGPASAAADPCALLTPGEIRAVQGEEIADAKSSRPERRRFAVAQCFYTLPTFSRSISLEVTRPDPARPGDGSPRERWREIFRPEPASLDELGDEEHGWPTRVEGLGDEAFWTSDGVVGALYVLKGDAWIRLSLGGPDDPKTKLEKSKRLAKKAIARL